MLTFREVVSAAKGPAPARLRRSELVKGALVGLVAGALVLPLIVNQAPTRSPGIIAPAQAVMHDARRADLGDAVASGDVREIADWVASTGDAASGPFIVIDKAYARMHVFDESARLVASTPILLGGARGDHTVAGIGQRAIEDVLPEERTTPAGRFVGQRGRNARGEDVVWVDYDSGVSMHRVLTTDPRERRLERLATPTHEDNRISWGCINVPVAFYEAQVAPMFAARRANVYILPEVRTMAQVFGFGADTHDAHAALAGRNTVPDMLP